MKLKVGDRPLYRAIEYRWNCRRITNSSRR